MDDQQINRFNSLQYLNKMSPKLQSSAEYLFKKISAELGLCKSYKKYELFFEATRSMIFNLSINNPFHISRRHGAYVILNRYKIEEYYKYSIIIPLLNTLEKLGYLTQKIGSEDEESETIITATDKFSILFHKSFTDIMKNTTRTPLEDPIILRDFPVVKKSKEWKDGKYIFRTTKIKKNIDYEETRFTKSIRKYLKKYNDFISDQEITLELHDLVVWPKFKERISQLSKIKYFQINTLTKNKVDIKLLANQCYRVFNNRSWKLGGRFYGGSILFIGANKKKTFNYRKGIKINGIDTVELDYSGLHIRMCYNKEGINYLDDPYDIPLFDRNELKKASLIMINADKPRKAIEALKDFLKNKVEYEDKPKEFISRTAKDLIIAFKNKHSLIAKYFCSGEGLKLQNIDSRIMFHIMRDLTKEKIPALFVHDSVITQVRFKDKLRQLMIKYYYKEMGFNPIIH